MAFKGEIQLGMLNTLVKTSGVAKYDIYRVQGSGNIEPNNLGVKTGDFVRWNGTKWELRDYQYALNADVTAQIYDDAGQYIKAKGHTAGNYWPDASELAYFHKGAIRPLTINGELVYVRITSDALTDEEGDTYFAYQTTDLMEAVTILESRIYTLEQANA